MLRNWLCWEWLVWAALLLCSASCRFQIAWSAHASYRSTGKDLQLAQVDPGEAVRGVIRAHLDYLTVSVDAAFMRNLPGLEVQVALGLEVRGVLPGGAPILSGLEVSPVLGKHGFVHFDNVARLEPFLYTGQDLSLTLHFREVPGAELSNLRGKLTATADLVRRLDPLNADGLRIGESAFRSIFEASSARGRSWRYQVTLHSAEGIHRDKPEVLLTAARHILVFVPPAGAPAEARSLKLDSLMPYLRLRGGRLIWRHSEQEYTETPYIVLNVTRYRRYPKTDTEVRKLAGSLAAALDDDALDRAQALCDALGAAIGRDRVITTQERALERGWLDLRRAQLAAARAAKASQPAEEMKHLAQQVRGLTSVRTQFAPILYPYETREIDYRVNALVNRAETLAREQATPAERVAALADAHRSIVASLDKPPPPPPKRAAAVDLAKLPPPPVVSEWKHLYERWWFWTTMTAAVAGVAALVYGVAAPPPTRTETNMPPGPSVPVPFPSGKPVRR